MAIEAVIVDYGNVLSRPQSVQALEHMASLAGLAVEPFLIEYWRHRDSYDRGLAARDYWKRVLNPHQVADSTITALIETDARSWMDYREELWVLIREIRANGYRTAVLSNGVPEIMSRIRAERSLDAWFDTVIVSYEVGCAKPDRSIYEVCLQKLGVNAQAAIFVDDRQEHLEAAEAVGMQTFHFTDDASVSRLRERLKV